MLETQTDAIIATLTERTIGTGEGIMLQDILSSDIPRGIKAYIQADTLQILAEELFAQPHCSRVDRSLPSTDRLTRAFLQTFARTYVFPRSEYLIVLENAVHFLENFLCRPQWTMENFIFAETDRVPVETMIRKFGHMAEYSYYREFAERIARRRRWENVERQQFRSLVGSIDEQIIIQHNARELALLAKPIFDFVLLRDTPPDVAIPLKPILIFFEDKKMDILRNYIESICRVRDKADLTLDELTTLVEDLYLGHKEESVGVAPQAQIPSPAANEQVSDGASPEEQPKEPEPLLAGPLLHSTIPWDLPTLGEPPTPPKREEEPAKPGPPPDHASGGRNIPLSLTFAGLDRPPLPPRGPADLNDMIPDDLRSRFIKTLFRKNEEEYDTAITTLNETGTWEDAALFLNKLYHTNGLDPFDADVVEFTDAIHRRYLNDEEDEQ